MALDKRKGDRHANPDARRAYMREKMRERRGNVRGGKPFAGIDGEGGGDDLYGFHAYFLLRTGKSRTVPRDGDVRIRSYDALEAIVSLDPAYTYVAYFFDYDVTKILEDLPWAKLDRLINREKRTRKDGRGVFPVDYGPYEIDYLPRKEFKVRRLGGPWVVINDVGPFFQCRFVEALKQWKVGTPQEIAAVEAGKNRRGSFEWTELPEIEAYCLLEIKLLEELMEKFRAACNEVGIIPAKWQGPGQLAKALMAKNGVPRSKEVPLLQDVEFNELLTYGRNAYYGGRPELSAIGPVNRPVYQFDLNSAYPAAMMSVPCLMHGGWEKEEYEGGMEVSRIRADDAIVYGTFTRGGPVHVPGVLSSRGTPRVPLWNGLPFRTETGTICYPGTGTGWYWKFEIDAAIHQQFTAYSAWVYNRQCECAPLSWIEGTYLQRLALGKDAAGMALKLAINSVYGICVQSIGKPEYANGIWGSYITAWCRTAVQNFIHSSPSCAGGACGSDVLMVATDSVATWRDRPEIEESKELGGWSREVHPRGMFLIQPGLYFGSSGKHAKTRGVPLAVIEAKEQEFRDAFDRMVKSRNLEDGDVRVPQRMFVGIRYALHRRNAKLLGQWIELGNEEGTAAKGGKVIRFDWTTKREAFPVIGPGPGHSYLETFPILGTSEAVSTPYSKDIGGLLEREAERLVISDQPDWVPMVEPGELA